MVTGGTTRSTSTEMTAILVTGGAGFVGSHVCKSLSRAGYVPVAYDDLSRGARSAVKWGPLEVGDVLDRGRLQQVMADRRVSAVIHLAGLTVVHESVAEPLRYYQVNVAGTAALLGAMREAGVSTIVLSSSCTVYHDGLAGALNEAARLAPASPYAQTKVMIEQLAADMAVAHGFRWLSLRYFNAAGADPAGELAERDVPKVRLIPNLLRAAAQGGAAFKIQGTDYPTADGTCVRDLVHVTDLAEAHVRALELLDHEPDSRFVNLGAGRGYSVREVLESVARVTGRPVAAAMAPRRPGDVAVRIADATLARRLLHWTPALVSLDDIVAHAWRSRAWDQD